MIKLERLPVLSSSRRPTARTSRPHQANVSSWAGRSTRESRQIHRMPMANPRQLVRTSCHRPGRSLLTGSANLLNLRGVSKPQWSLCLVHAPWGSSLARGRLAQAGGAEIAAVAGHPVPPSLACPLGPSLRENASLRRVRLHCAARNVVNSTNGRPRPHRRAHPRLGARDHVAFAPDATLSLRSGSVRRRGDYARFPIGPKITAGSGR